MSDTSPPHLDLLPTLPHPLPPSSSTGNREAGHCPHTVGSTAGGRGSLPPAGFPQHPHHTPASHSLIHAQSNQGRPVGGVEEGRNGETPEGLSPWWAVPPQTTRKTPVSPPPSVGSSLRPQGGQPVTCCLVLETHVSSSRSRRERWKAQVVLTAMKMSPSCSSRGPGFGWLSLSVPRTVRSDEPGW